MANSQFIASIHKDYLPFVAIATDAELAQFIRAQICLANGEEIPELSGVARALFETHCALIKRLEESGRKKSEIGKTGGAKYGNQNARKQAGVDLKQEENNQKQPELDLKQPRLKKNKPVTDTVSVTVSDTITNNTPDMLTHIIPKGDSDSPFDIALKDFSDMRKKIKSPLTEKAKTLILNKLERVAPNDEGLKVEILEQSTMNGWKSIYPLSESSNTNTGGRVNDGKGMDGTPAYNPGGMSGFRNALDEFDEGEYRRDTG